jgi:hypothetical protein
MSTVSRVNRFDYFKFKKKLESRNLGARRGQALIEYVLLVSLVSTLTFGFVRLMSQEFFGAGLRALPLKVNACVSHTRARNVGDCR